MSYRKRNNEPAEIFAGFARRREQVCILIHERPNIMMEGKLMGVDEFMNIVLSDVVEINTRTNETTKLGSLLLKSDCIAMVGTKPQ
jgi:small nuclear ribonucleoprotein E